jgi:hypothetical protein
MWRAEHSEKQNEASALCELVFTSIDGGSREEMGRGSRAVGKEALRKYKRYFL